MTAQPDQPAVSPDVAALLAAMASGRHPGFVSVKTSFPELDGTFTTIEVSVPADADDAEIARRLELAQRVQTAVRSQFFWGGPDINPANHIIPFGKHKGETLGQLAIDFPDDLKWLAYQATQVSPAFKLAAQWVYERGSGIGQAEPEYSAPIGRGERPGASYTPAPGGYAGPE